MNLQAEVDFYSSLASIKMIFLSPADSFAISELMDEWVQPWLSDLKMLQDCSLWPI